MTSPWLLPEVAHAQRALVDEQLQQLPMPPHFQAFVDAVKATNCPGQIVEVGAASGYGREILDRAGVPYRDYAGIDISPEAIRIARERYPESNWVCDAFGDGSLYEADVVVDAACLMHIDSWREHLAALCRASRRWVVLHRVPFGDRTAATTFSGYGQDFPAWRFAPAELTAAMTALGFVPQASYEVGDPGARTLTFAKKRHFVSYCDSAYLPRLKALHASMVRHCGSFELHVLAFDEARDRMGDVERWCREQASVSCMVAPLFLASHPELELDKLPGSPRTRVEHFWTCGPRWIADVMERTGEPATYVDADVLFFSSPEPVFAEIGGAPAAVVPHGFARASQGLPGPTVETHEVFGRFNVGIVHVADRRIAEDWAERCRAWCYDRLENVGGRVLYGDQVHLQNIVMEWNK